LVESIRAKVVDDSSGEPLEGVHVVFKATAYEGTFTGHGGRKVNLLVAEGITNATGIIELPAQKIDPEPFWFNTHYDYPWIYFFKSGYLPAIEKNPWNGLASLETVQRWQYNGKTVRLKKPNYFNEYIEKISFLGNEIERIYRYPPPEQCEWKRIPRMFLYLDREYSLILERARQANRYLSLPTIASLQQHYWESRCGSAIEFFGKYGGSQ
jgi:hypothetical protein